MRIDPVIGRLNTLRVASHHASGVLLDGGKLGGILLPNRHVPEKCAIGDEIEVFLMQDSEDRLIATTDRPLAMAGEIVALEVAATTRIGAFLDWGMPKDLLLPFGEQTRHLHAGDTVVVHVDVDPVSGRLCASAKLNRFVSRTAPRDAAVGTPVSLLIAERTELGFKAVVDGRFWGLLHAGSAAATTVCIGEKHPGYISRITADHLADVTLEPPGYGKVANAAERLAAALAGAPHGFLPLHDKSSPLEIRMLLGMSKKVFKQALGALYRSRKVRLSDEGIHWQGDSTKP